MIMQLTLTQAILQKSNFIQHFLRIYCKNLTFYNLYCTIKLVMSMIERKEYLEELIRFKDKELIKVVTGIRRCGKSTLFDLYCEYLLKSGIEKDQIIRINLEDMSFREIDTYTKLYDYIDERLNPQKMNYVFIDEVQNIDKFQKACDGLFIKKNVDLYITRL